MNKNLRARDVDKSSTSQADNDWANNSRSILNANSDADSCGLDQRETEENEEDSFFWFGLMLAERDAKRNAGCGVMQGNSDHKVNKSRNIFAHAKSYSLKNRVDTES